MSAVLYSYEMRTSRLLAAGREFYYIASCDLYVPGLGARLVVVASLEYG